MTHNTETISCGCCGGITTVDARSAAAQYAYGNDPAARAMRHHLVTVAASGRSAGAR
ncbi:hypothetical protein ACIBCT_37450 [Streptosporangium sp. NPDC050855]|uniref:hypothetical protein n=1 Tax=Streptosporangium sp. NPDC050855 TaxID=3366194 RepID=UPI0037B95070